MQISIITVSWCSVCLSSLSLSLSRALSLSLSLRVSAYVRVRSAVFAFLALLYASHVVAHPDIFWGSRVGFVQCEVREDQESINGCAGGRECY